MSLRETPEFFSDVLKVLQQQNISFVVVGGVAAILHGLLRPVADLDIVIDPGSEQAQRALNALTIAGFVPSIPLPLSMLTVMRLFDRHSREVDVFVRYQIPFAELWSGSWIAQIGDVSARVQSLEHLLEVLKIIGRPGDLQHIEELMRIQRNSIPKH